MSTVTYLRIMSFNQCAAIRAQALELHKKKWKLFTALNKFIAGRILSFKLSLYVVSTYKRLHSWTSTAPLLPHSQTCSLCHRGFLPCPPCLFLPSSCPSAPSNRAELTPLSSSYGWNSISPPGMWGQDIVAAIFENICQTAWIFFYLFNFFFAPCCMLAITKETAGLANKENRNVEWDVTHSPHSASLVSNSLLTPPTHPPPKPPASFKSVTRPISCSLCHESRPGSFLIRPSQFE